MSWRAEKTKNGQDLVWDGVELGIAPSPTKGTANIQNANIATSTGEVMASYGRTNQAQVALSSQTLTPDGATNFTGPATLQAGTWIKVTASTVSSITAATNPATVTVNYLAVGGGGGGGPNFNEGAGGGGGGGEVATGTYAAGVGSYTVTIGAGGAGGSGLGTGNVGNASAFGAVDTALGGGYGGLGVGNVSPVDPVNGGNGASGGGGGGGGVGYGGTGGTGSPGGNGGAGFASATTNQRAGGGGGGAGGAGSAGASTVGGNGGAGTSSSITGTAVFYGAGGGGGGSTAGTGGSSGAGGSGGSSADGADGVTPGSGGGGPYSNSTTEYTGGDGADGIVVISYTTGSMFATGGTITYSGGNTIHTFTIPSDFTGSQYTADFTVHSISTGGLYYVSYKSGTTFKLSAYYDPTGANALTHGTTGSITFNTLTTPNSAVAKATEKYTTATTTEYRYYVLDANGYVWVYDTAIFDTYSTTWMLPDPTDYSGVKLTGMAILNGWVMTVGMANIFGKPTVNLGTQFTMLPNVYMNEPFPTHRKYAMVGSQGKMYYCDGNYIGELFPTTSLETSIANIQSYAKYTASTTTGILSFLVGGSLPYSPEGTRIPAVFFTDQYGTLPTAVTAGTVYYIRYNAASADFNVYTALTGGSQVDIETGASGNQYFNTFYPLGPDAGVDGTDTLVQWTGQRMNLPFYETAQTLVEIGNTVLIGCNGSIVYPWNQIDATPSDIIALPESDVRTMVNANNMAYIFAGNKGNVYISNGSIASLALKVPDYCAGVPGTPLTYIEPYFTWGDSMYLRGRVYFSILDQTATKAGNCGGNWSFIPVQNIDPTQDVGVSLRLENQNSYGDYDGYSTILIPNEEQAGSVSPQYWAFWQDSYSTGTSTFGVDQTNTVPVTQYVVETDLAPTGTFLDQQTFNQVEYKLTTPMASGDAVALYYRLNSTDAWTTCGTVVEETANKLSGYYNQAFQKTQWVQFRAVVTTGGTTASSFVRLAQIRLR